jgi:Zn-dependent membrane protease YugP
MHTPLLAASLRDSAAEWVQQQIERLGLGKKLAVAARHEEDRGAGHFYHPATGTIVRGDRVHGEHTVRARAIAAHELGHAVFTCARGCRGC